MNPFAYFPSTMEKGRSGGIDKILERNLLWRRHQHPTLHKGEWNTAADCPSYQQSAIL